MILLKLHGILFAKITVSGKTPRLCKNHRDFVEAPRYSFCQNHYDSAKFTANPNIFHVNSDISTASIKSMEQTPWYVMLIE
jgi:hypothetical protein